MTLCLVFFFSSRRRHTRCLSDWSSDVCSSDLGYVHDHRVGTVRVRRLRHVDIARRLEPRIHAARQRISEIGRASCRERVEISDGGGSLKRKRWKDRKGERIKSHHQALWRYQYG